MKRTLNIYLTQAIGISILMLLVGTIAMGKGKPDKPTQSEETPVVVTFTSGLDIESDGGSYIDGEAGVSAVFTEFNHMHLSVGDRALNIDFDSVVTSADASPVWIGSIPFSGSLSFRVKEVANVPDTTNGPGPGNPALQELCDELYFETGKVLCAQLNCQGSSDPACSSNEDGGSMDGYWYVRRTGLALNLKPDGERLSYSFWYKNPNDDYDTPDESAYVRIFHVGNVWVLSPERVEYGSAGDKGPLGTLIRLSRKSVQAGQYLVDFRASVREINP